MWAEEEDEFLRGLNQITEIQLENNAITVYALLC